MWQVVAVGIALFLASESAGGQALTREYCRNQADESEMVRCIEQKLYDPCDDSSAVGSGWWTAQCAWAHLRIAERKMSAIEQAIVGRLKKASSESASAIKELKLAQKRWRESRDAYCRFANSIKDVDGLEGEVLGYCIKRLTQTRTKELESMLHDEQ